jgi:hypothetical protein
MYQVVPGPVGASTEAMVMERAAEACWAGLLLSVTVAVNVDAPVAAGVPEMTPVVAASVSPAGSLPDEIDQV